MVSVWFFPVLLLSAPLLDAAAAAPPPTYRDTDPRTGLQVQCDRCAPGTYLRKRCTSTQRSECAPCPPGSFTELWNYIGKCLRCGVCGQNQVVKRPCSADSDLQCECKPGFYFKKSYDMCLRHSECESGQEVLTQGTAEEDTVCQTCPNGTFSDSTSTLQNCTVHKSCDAAGLQLVLKGSTWHDSVCTTCQERQTKDGAAYLKEILPAFFVHQKLSLRRLRQIVHKLPSVDGRSQGRTSGLNLPDLHQRIDAWVASSTAAQIRQLPEILRKTGANGAGDRLQNKIERVDSNLTKICDLGNEVEVV